MYNQMIAGLGDQMCSALMDSLQPAAREQEARAFAAQQGSGSGQSGIDPNTGNATGIGDPVRNDGKFRTAPKVPMCYAESVASTVISKNKDQIETANKNVVRSLNMYLEGVQGEMDSVSSTLSAGREAMENGLGDLFGDFGANADVISGGMDGAVNMIPDVAGGLGAALDFANVIANVFAGELEPKKAINDFYQLATGGSGAAASELPSVESIGASVAESGTARAERITTPPQQPDFATPRKNEPDVQVDLDDAGYDDANYNPDDYLQIA